MSRNWLHFWYSICWKHWIHLFYYGNPMTIEIFLYWKLLCSQPLGINSNQPSQLKQGWVICFWQLWSLQTCFTCFLNVLEKPIAMHPRLLRLVIMIESWVFVFVPLMSCCFNAFLCPTVLALVSWFKPSTNTVSDSKSLVF